MNKRLNLAPVEELLTTSICPQELAQELDEIMLDYIHAVTHLHLATNGKADVIHNQTSDYIFRIRELRDVFDKCAK